MGLKNEEIGHFLKLCSQKHWTLKMLNEKKKFFLLFVGVCSCMYVCVLGKH